MAALVMSDVPTAYVRDPYSPKQSFIQKNWWVGFIAMLVLFGIVVALLYYAIRWHFKEAEQDQRRKEIEENNGEFISACATNISRNTINNGNYSNDNGDNNNNNNNNNNALSNPSNLKEKQPRSRRKGNPLYV